MVLAFVFESFSLLVAPVSGCCSVKTYDGLGRSLGGVGTVLGGLWAVFGRSWAALGRSQNGLGAILGQSWAVLVRSWGSWGCLGRKCCSLIGFKLRIDNHNKNVVFPL